MTIVFSSHKRFESAVLLSLLDKAMEGAMSALINNIREDEFCNELFHATIVGACTVFMWLGSWSVAFVCLGLFVL